MDTKALVKKLREVFVENNKGDKKYSAIWLSQLNYGGLYYSKNYALHLKTEYKIERYLSEIQHASSLLRESATEEAKFILRVSLYSAEEKAEPESEDYVVYEAADATT